MSASNAKSISYFSSQTGFLRRILEKHPSLEERIVAWLTGEKPILIIGGEPASGKSLLMGELVLLTLQDELAQLRPDLQRSAALISYDQVHNLVCEHLAQICNVKKHNILPEGETCIELRQYITDIMRDALAFVSKHLAKNAPIILEAPLIGQRGEAIVDELTTKQVLIMYSPAMWMRIHDQGRQKIRERSAQVLAMKQIHEALLKERDITHDLKSKQDEELERSWKQWVSSRDGMVLTWDPSAIPELEHTITILQTKGIPIDPIKPKELREFTLSRIKKVLGKIQDPYLLAAKVFVD